MPEFSDVPEDVEEAVVSGGIVGSEVSSLVPDEVSDPEVPGLTVGSESPVMLVPLDWDEVVL